MNQNALEKAWSEHSLLWDKNLWVYPVISRRAGGLSIGINLNPDKKCTFNCAYCQVDRTIPGSPQEIDVNTMKIQNNPISPRIPPVALLLPHLLPSPVTFSLFSIAINL